MKQGAIFDMDGLLTDTERIYAASWRETAAYFRQPWVEGFDQAVAGTSGEKMRGVIRAHFPSVDPDAFRNHCMELASHAAKSDLRAMPGAGDILRYFHDCGVKLAVASSNSLSLIRSNLERLDLLRFFDALASGDELPPGHEKPAPDIFLLAARRIGCAPEACYVFEDGVNGSYAGIAAGCATIMIADLFQPTEELRERCAGIFHSLSEAMTAIAEGRL